MPPLTSLETRIREEHENDTARELSLVQRTERAAALRAEILADGRVDGHDIGALREILDLVPPIATDAMESLKYNRTINGMYGQLAQRRRSA